MPSRCKKLNQWIQVSKTIVHRLSDLPAQQGCLCVDQLERQECMQPRAWTSNFQLMLHKGPVLGGLLTNQSLISFSFFATLHPEQVTRCGIPPEEDNLTKCE